MSNCAKCGAYDKNDNFICSDCHDEAIENACNHCSGRCLRKYDLEDVNRSRAEQRKQFVKDLKELRDRVTNCCVLCPAELTELIQKYGDQE